MNKKKNVRYLTELALLMALELVMYFTPLGMLPLPGQYASLLTVPVGFTIGAGVSIPAIIVLTICTRTLMGFLTGWIFKLIDRIDKTNTIDCFVGGLLAPVLNTILYMTVYVIILLNNELLQNVIASTVGEGMLETLRKNVILFVAAYVGIQAVIEAAVGCVVSGGVTKALRVVLKR